MHILSARFQYAICADSGPSRSRRDVPKRTGPLFRMGANADSDVSIPKSREFFRSGTTQRGRTYKWNPTGGDLKIAWAVASIAAIGGLG